MKNKSFIAIALLSLTISVLFCFIIYPKISISQHAVLDSDGWGQLGHGIYYNQSLSYYPDIQPTLNRGPVYPLFLASALYVTGTKWYPCNIQLAQCILFSITCLLIFWIASKLFNKKSAIIASLICSAHPLLVWFCPRIWIEIVATLFFTSLIASIIYFHESTTGKRAALIGIMIGICALCKSTFLPFVLFIPALLIIFRGTKQMSLKHAGIIAVIAMITIAPWTVRNYMISGKIVPVHLLAGFNFKIGDSTIEHFFESPFCSANLFIHGENRIKELNLKTSHMQRSASELTVEKILINESFSKYLSNKYFLAKKIIFNSVLFWTLGENARKSMVIGLFQIPLLTLFIISIIMIIKNKEFMTIKGLIISVVILYYLLHLPIYSIARFGIVLFPMMIVFASSLFIPNQFCSYTQEHSK